MSTEKALVRPRLIPSTRFLLALLVCLGYVILYAQRINLSIAIVCMVNKTNSSIELEPKGNVQAGTKTSLFFKEKQFLWSEWDQQIILGSYWIGYILTLVSSGWLSITMGSKLIFAISILISSLATFALSSIYFFQNQSFPLIVSLRILIGAAHGSIGPVTYTLWAYWVVPDERGTLISIGAGGTNIGTAFIVLVGGLLCRYMNSGWMHTFLLSGILGFIWLPLWMWQVSDSPEQHKSISNNEREYIHNIIGKNISSKNRRPISLRALPWRKMIQSKAVIALFFTELCNLSGYFFFLSNLGKILTEIYHIPNQYTGYILAIGSILTLLSSLLAGTIADILVRKNLIKLTNVRKLFNSLSSFIPCLCMIAFCFCDETRQILGVINVIVLLFSSGFAFGSGYIVNFSDIVPAFSGLIFGIVTAFSSLSAVIGNIIAGILITHPTLHDWRRLFILFFIVYLIGGLIYLPWGSAVPEEWATFKSQEQEQNGVKSYEEILPMQQQQTIEPTAAKDTESDKTAHITA